MLSYKKIIHILFSIILLSSVFSCKSTDDRNFTVEGKLEGLEDSQVFIVKNYSQDSLSVDTIKDIENGIFRFEGKVENPTLVTLFYTDKYPPLCFVIDKNYSVQIKGKASDPLSIDIKGGEINNDLNSFRNENKNLLTSRFRAFDKNSPVDPAQLKNIDFQLSRVVRDYVEQNPTKLASVILMNEYAKGTLAPELLSQDIKLLQGAAADYYLTTSLRDYNDFVMSSMVGADAPQIELESTKGKLVKLSDYKGKNVLLIFDLKDAPLNKIYFSKLKEAQNELKKKVEFLAIVVDEDARNPTKGTLDIANSLDWTVLLDSKKWNSKEVIKYNIKTLPYMILVSPEGKILERDISVDSLVVNADHYFLTDEKK